MQTGVGANYGSPIAYRLVAGAAAEVQKPYHDPWTAGVCALSQALIVYLLALGRCATDLIDHVHRGLGRYRSDDVRQGWISGLDEQAGHHHPTKGGLRIGKPLKERQLGEPINERLEWDRDGQ